MIATVKLDHIRKMIQYISLPPSEGLREGAPESHRDGDLMGPARPQF